MKRVLFLFLWCIASCCFAQDEGHVRFLKYQADYRVNADATFSVVREFAYRLLTDAALVNSGKMPISYSSKMEQADLMAAYTLKKDGRRIDVGASGIQTQQGMLAAGTGISQADQSTLMITFPHLEIGDTVVYRYRMTQKEPVFPGQFYMSSVFSRGLAWDAIDVSVDVPASLPLQIEAVQVDSLPASEQDGRRIYRWQARNLPIIANEPAAVNMLASTPHLIASTFKDWGEFAAAYEARAAAKAAVTPAIALMAGQITRGIQEPRAQAQALYEWVAKNVRYVASWVGNDGWVPHDAESVLTKRYGDCKDHVVLLEALLAAKGIQSTTVMINSDKTSYALPSVVYPAFNHVITYLPAFDLYLDSTAGSATPFAVLPIADMDKPVIHTAGYSGVRRTPMAGPAQFSVRRLTRLVLADDGAVTGELSITARGAAAIELRELQQSIGKRKEAEWVREMLDAKNFEGDGTIVFDDGANGESFTMRLNVSIRNFLAIAENGTIPLSPLVVGPIAFDHLRAIYKRAARTLPYWCPAWSLEDRYEIRMPKTFRLILPRGRTIAERGFSYLSSYESRDGLLTTVRRLEIERPALACQPAEYADSKLVVARIERDLRAQVIYQATEQASGQATEPAWGM
ncbi:MAG: DUF3857 and transglutaminase domain-containing protein [Pseudomonadota bacterium]